MGKYNLNLSLIILIALIFFCCSMITTSYQVYKLKEVIILGEQVVVQNKINYSLEEEYRIQIAYWAKIYGADLNKSLRIVRAESNFKNVCNYESCAYGQGIYMFIPGTWKSTGLKMKQVTGSTMDPYLNIQRGNYLLATEGDYHWDMSKDNWK